MDTKWMGELRGLTEVVLRVQCENCSYEEEYPVEDSSDKSFVLLYEALGYDGWRLAKSAKLAIEGVICDQCLEDEDGGWEVT